MEVVVEETLDYYMHYNRLCPMDCCGVYGEARPRSPVINCQKVCTKSELDVSLT